MSCSGAYRGAFELDVKEGCTLLPMLLQYSHLRNKGRADPESFLLLFLLCAFFLFIRGIFNMPLLL
jgi:hypothetical protein